MKPRIQNGIGIILEIRKAGEGGRLLRLFSEAPGQISCFVSKGTLKKYGTGFLFPFSEIRYTLALSPERRILIQYEGRFLPPVSNRSYEEIAQWYYAAEIVMNAFPEGVADGDVFFALKKAAEESTQKNPTVIAFILAIRLLVLAGFDPSEEDPIKNLALSDDAAILLRAFRYYDGKGRLAVPVKKEIFHECAAYLDKFIEMYMGLDMKTKGAFSGRFSG